MNPLPPSLRPGVAAGMAAGLCSLAVLALRGRTDAGSTAAAINAPSHWLFGDRSLRQQDWSIRYSVTGLAIHQLSAVMWGLIHHQRRPSPERPFQEAALTTAAAAFIDLALTPRRLTPGFEERLRPRSLVWVYALFAVGLAVGGRLGRRR